LVLLLFVVQVALNLLLSLVLYQFLDEAHLHTVVELVDGGTVGAEEDSMVDRHVYMLEARHVGR
jgi:hypothetical protein